MFLAWVLCWFHPSTSKRPFSPTNIDSVLIGCTSHSQPQFPVPHISRRFHWLQRPWPWTVVRLGPTANENFSQELAKFVVGWHIQFQGGQKRLHFLESVDAAMPQFGSVNQTGPKQPHAATESPGTLRLMEV